MLVLFPFLRNGQCLACVHTIWDVHGQLGEHEGSVRDAQGITKSISSYLSTLPAIQVHLELDGCMLDIV